MAWMLRNSGGKPDAMLTAAVTTLVAVLGKFLAAGTVVVWGAKTITFGALDGGLVAALLAPTFGAYVARRYHSRETTPKV